MSAYAIRRRRLLNDTRDARDSNSPAVERRYSFLSPKFPRSLLKSGSARCARPSHRVPPGVWAQVEAKFVRHPGPFLFEFQRHGLATEEFCSRLDGFFGQLPKDFRYAVEIRITGLVGSEYRKVLETHSVAHVYNHWSYMP